MNISTNDIDLLYLTNSKTFNNDTALKNQELYTQEELKKYRTKIFEQTRDILTGKSVNKDIKYAFDEYIKVSINHFKFINKRNIIQQDYTNIKISEKKISKIDYNETNKLVYKKDKPVHIRITDCIPVKRKKKNKKKMIIPKQRDFSNHKQAEKKKKNEKNVVEKDNIIIRYDEKKIKEKNKKKKKEKNDS
jgi:hypothetical protein